MSELKLTKAEQETIITFSASDTTANIYTTDPVWERRIQKIEAPHKDGAGWSVDVPKKWVRVQRPPKVSEEAAKKRSEALKKVQSARKSMHAEAKKNNSN